jgi:hypothetical protein
MVAVVMLVVVCGSVALSACGAADDGSDTRVPGGGNGGGGAGGVGGRAGGGAGMSGGCGPESFATIYQTIFASQTYSCNTTACHGRMDGQSGSVGKLELLTKEAAYKDLVGVKSDSLACGDGTYTRVVPGDAAGSLLVQKLKAETVKCGSIMPISGIPVADVDLARIVAWINGGACNN